MNQNMTTGTDPNQERVSIPIDLMTAVVMGIIKDKIRVMQGRVSSSSSSKHRPTPISKVSSTILTEAMTTCGEMKSAVLKLRFWTFLHLSYRPWRSYQIRLLCAHPTGVDSVHIVPFGFYNGLLCWLTVPTYFDVSKQPKAGHSARTEDAVSVRDG